MKIYFAIALISLSSINVAASNDASEQTRAVINQLFEAFNRHDTSALVELYASDAQLFSPGDTQASIGHAAVREIYDGHFENIPAVHDAVTNLVVEGTRGAVEFTASWSQATSDDAEARGMLRIASFITVENGKIVSDVTYFDRVELGQNMDIESNTVSPTDKNGR